MPADYTKRLSHWAACGGRKPRYRWLGLAPRSLPFWAGCVYTAGALLYNVGCTTNLADQFESVYLSPTAQVPLALCFLLPCCLEAIQHAGTHLEHVVWAARSSGWRPLRLW